MSAWQIVANEAPRFFTYWNMLFLVQAVANTALTAVLGCAIGYAAGFVLSVLRLPQVVPIAPLRWIATGWVELFRRIPFLVLLLLVFFLGQFTRMEPALWATAVAAVAIRMSALAAENLRAGLESVRPTQWEAALTMNLPPLRALSLVVLPQAWRVVLPPSVVHVLSMVKETSLLSQIGFVELTFAAKMLTQRGFSAILTYGTALVLYFVLSGLLAWFGWWLEQRLGRRPLRLSRATL